MIRVLYFEEGCPHHAPTSKQVRAIANRATSSLAVEDIEVTTL
jgi:hypothetical protein